MSRSGYSDDYDYDDDGKQSLYRAAVKRAMTGQRGQAALRELLAALNAMPVKALVAESLATADGEFCTLGVLGHARGIDMSSMDPEDYDAVAMAFDIAPSMVREIEYENDDDFGFNNQETPVRRWARMRSWVETQLKAPSEVSE